MYQALRSKGHNIRLGLLPIWYFINRFAMQLLTLIVIMIKDTHRCRGEIMNFRKKFGVANNVITNTWINKSIKDWNWTHKVIRSTYKNDNFIGLAHLVESLNDLVKLGLIKGPMNQALRSKGYDMRLGLLPIWYFISGFAMQLPTLIAITIRFFAKIVK